jgi:hypothetical protein
LKVIIPEYSSSAKREFDGKKPLVLLRVDSTSRFLDQSLNGKRQSVTDIINEVTNSPKSIESHGNRLRGEELEKVMTRQRSLHNITNSLSKFKNVRESTQNWTTIDLNLNCMSRGSSKVFPNRIQTSDPMSFKTDA